MKLRISLSLACLVVVIAFFPYNLVAQDSNPPHCCNVPTVAGSTGVQSRIVMADSTLATMGMSRAQFVDRMIAVLMPGRQVSVVYSTTLSLNAAAAVSADGASPEAVTVTQQYRVSRDMMRLEDIEALDQLSLTDGVVSIAISFRRSVSSAELP